MTGLFGWLQSKTHFSSYRNQWASWLKSSCVNNRARLDNERWKILFVEEVSPRSLLFAVGCCAFKISRELSTLFEARRQLLTRPLEIISNDERRLFGPKREKRDKICLFVSVHILCLKIIDFRVARLKCRLTHVGLTLNLVSINYAVPFIHTADFQMARWYGCDTSAKTNAIF